MPQMAPLWWLSLFITFSMILILFTSMNFYTPLPLSSDSSSFKMTNSSLNWKW